jgi:hypothetical protein
MLVIADIKLDEMCPISANLTCTETLVVAWEDGNNWISYWS